MLSDRELNVSVQKKSTGGWEGDGESGKCLEGDVGGKHKRAYHAGRFWKALGALEKLVSQHHGYCMELMSSGCA